MKTKRCTAAEAEKLARTIHLLRSHGVGQEMIAKQLNISRDSVAKYLAPNCKAALRAGVIT